jgi:hypothetical protein
MELTEQQEAKIRGTIVEILASEQTQAVKIEAIVQRIKEIVKDENTQIS